MRVSSPRGSSFTKFHAFAFFKDKINSSSVEFGEASKRFCLMVVSNKKGSCDTMPILFLNSLREKFLIFVPPIKIFPSTTS